MTKKGSLTKEKTALEVAVAMLARREHSRVELAQKLRQKGFVAGEIELALDHLAARNYLNDERFAAVRAGYRAEQSKWGPMKIRQELVAKGVGREIADEALDEIEGEVDGNWLATAKLLLKRKFKEPLIKAGVEDGALGGREAWDVYNKEKAKRIGFLVRRGFTMGQALAALGNEGEDVVD